MSEQTKVGVILDAEQPRDAIHVAIVSVIADERLVPGSHVGFTRKDSTEHVGVRTLANIGVVDPYLTTIVEREQRFYLFLYPQTITSLRHNWTHPAFQAQGVTAAPDKAVSEAWLRYFCKKSDCPVYETVMAALSGTLTGDPEYGGRWGYIDDEYFHFSGRDAHDAIPPAFWEHVEIVLGKKFADKPASFSCSC